MAQPFESQRSADVQRAAPSVVPDAGKEAVLSVARDADRLNGGKVPDGQKDMVRDMMEKVSSLPPELQAEFSEAAKVQAVGVGIERGRALSGRNTAVEDALEGGPADPSKLLFL